LQFLIIYPILNGRGQATPLIAEGNPFLTYTPISKDFQASRPASWVKQKSLPKLYFLKGAGCLERRSPVGWLCLVTLGGKLANGYWDLVVVGFNAFQAGLNKLLGIRLPTAIGSPTTFPSRGTAL